MTGCNDGGSVMLASIASSAARIAASSTVGIYMDEVAMPYTVMTRGLVFDTERVV